MIKKILIIILLFLALSCSGPVPDCNKQLSSCPVLFPDYTDITIPCNIAPLNFYVKGSDRISVLVKGKSEYRFSSRSSLIEFPLKKWKKMLENEKGNILDIFVIAKSNGECLDYLPFKWTVAMDSIDHYLSYRLIEPAYEVWNHLQIYERNLENFDTHLLGDNDIAGHSCINCHTSNHGDIQTTFMHVRGANGGTIYSRNGVVRKLDMKTEKYGAAVYGEIEGSGRYGIFTTALIMPILHSYRTERLEVFDKKSDLILVDFDKRIVSSSPLISGEEFQETFPCFSSDYNKIYFCRASHLKQPDSTRKMHYNLYSIDFDKVKGRLGDKINLVFDAEEKNKSVSFPKCSPDGKYILFSVSEYGTFPIWHTDTDLWMMNLATGKIDTLNNTNGRYSDSYHSWSSNSRWIVFASKRDDRVYGRPYFAYVDDSGRVSKPFVLPLKDPESYLVSLKSYNIPELYNTPEAYNAVKLKKLYYKADKEIFKYAD